MKMKNGTLINIFLPLREELSNAQTRRIQTDKFLESSKNWDHEKKSLQKRLWYSKYSFSCRCWKGEVCTDDNYTAKAKYLSGVSIFLFSRGVGACLRWSQKKSQARPLRSVWAVLKLWSQPRFKVTGAVVAFRRLLFSKGGKRIQAERSVQGVPSLLQTVPKNMEGTTLRTFVLLFPAVNWWVFISKRDPVFIWVCVVMNVLLGILK